ncbi:MAG: hypothetical protein ACK5OB_11415 [Pirellula sp.]
MSHYAFMGIMTAVFMRRLPIIIRPVLHALSVAVLWACVAVATSTPRSMHAYGEGPIAPAIASLDPDASLRAGLNFELSEQLVADALDAPAGLLGSTNSSSFQERELAIEPCASDDVSSEIWELSTRHMPERFRCISTESPGFDVHRLADGCWRSDSLERALADDGRLVIFYVHGNFMERNNSLQRVRIIDGYLRRRAHRSYRLIMLSWPSQPEPHPYRNVLENAEGAEDQSLYLAWLLEQLGDRSQVSLLGFSFGGRTVTGALHLVSGGTIPGLSHSHASGTPDLRSIYRVGLVAPAVDRTWLSPTGRHRHALDRVDGLVNLYNSSDPVLRRFRFLDRMSRPIAAGFTGFESLANPRITEPLAGQPAIRQYDCSQAVGNTHSERTYYSQCPCFMPLLDHLLWNEPSGASNVH